MITHILSSLRASNGKAFRKQEGKWETGRGREEDRGGERDRRSYIGLPGRRREGQARNRGSVIEAAIGSKGWEELEKGHMTWKK